MSKAKTTTQKEKNLKNKDIEIRRFNKKDLPAVYRMIQDTIAVCYSGFYPPEAIEFFKDYHNKENIIKDAAAGYTIVAECNGEIVGTGTLLDTNIRRVYINPLYQRQGIGKTITQRLEKKAFTMGLSNLDLEGSLNSRVFWESQGFTIQEEAFLSVRNGKKLIYFTMGKEINRHGM